MPIRAAATRVSTFLTHVRGRHVFRVSLFYAAAAWVVLQVGQSVLPIVLEGPQPWLRALLILLVGGFPAALALGWYFDLRPQRADQIPGSAEPAPRGSLEPGDVQIEATAIETLSSEERAAFARAKSLLEERVTDPLAKGLAILNQLAESAPTFAGVHAARAEALALLVDAGAITSSEALPKAKRAAGRAIELDSGLAAGYEAAGLVATLDWDWATAEFAFARAVELAPHSARIRHRYAVYLAAVGRVRDAIQQANIARELDPDSCALQTLNAALHYYAHDADRAVVEARAAIKSQPASAFPRLVLALALEQRGEAAQAAGELKSAMAAGVANEGLMLAALGHVYAKTGRTEDAARTLKAIISRRRTNPPDATAAPYFAIAALQAALGETDAAFESLRRAVGERDGWLLALRVHPWLDDLRSDDRYSEIVSQMRFSGELGDERLTSG